MLFNFIILIRARQFHFNFCCIQGWLFVLHFVDNIAILVMRILMITETIDDSNPTSMWIFWIPMNVTIGCTFAGNYTSEYGFFKIKDQEIPVIINGWEYYWGADFHPSILNGTYGCKIPIKWLEDVAENMSNFHYRTKSATEQQESSMKNFLKTIRFTDNTAPTEMAWACISPISRCCGIGCCSKDMKAQSNSIFHSVFGYMCGGFMLLCCFVLLLSLVMFLCNDVWHRYIPWFPSSPRPPATPRGEAHEMQELNPASHRSPSRMHLAA
ncbi:unnamed protein product [Caenorhabditis brenneri]